MGASGRLQKAVTSDVSPLSRSTTRCLVGNWGCLAQWLAFGKNERVGRERKGKKEEEEGGEGERERAHLNPLALCSSI